MSKADKLFTVDDIDRYVKRSTSQLAFTLFDVILILLYSDKNEGLIGKTKQMKEIFLTLVELQTLKAEKVKFGLNKFGPYSEDVEDAIDNLLFLNYVSAVGSKNENNFGIKITDKGTNYIKNAFEKLPQSTRLLLKNKREQWDTLTPQGVVNYVYTHYPKYLAESVFKKRYAPIDWEDENAGD